MLSPSALQVVVALCCVALALVSGVLFCVSRVCMRPSTKVTYGADVAAQRQRQEQQRAARQSERQFVVASQPPVPSAPSLAMAQGGGYGGRAERGVAYDERTGQFIVQGQPYGAYQFDPARGYYPSR